MTRKKTISFLFKLCALLLLGIAPLAAQKSTPLNISALHPVAGDLARVIGGERVQVKNILSPGNDPHQFDPTPRDLITLQRSDLVLASGKGLEHYLERLRQQLGDTPPIFEIGEKVPSLKVEEGELFLCCPVHSVGSLDPHWWHSVKNMERASGYLAEKLSEIDPAGESYYEQRAKDYQRELRALHDWINARVRTIPKSQRKLVTAHAAFGYFCRDYGFQAITIQGLDKSIDPTPQYFAQTIQTIEKKKITALFPETLANPRVISAIASQTGVKIGPTLCADGLRSEKDTYVEMMRSNVQSIVQALNPSS